MKASNSQVKQELPVVFGQDIKQDVQVKYCSYCFIRPRLGRTKIMALGRNRMGEKKKKKKEDFEIDLFYAIAQKG